MNIESLSTEGSITYSDRKVEIMLHFSEMSYRSQVLRLRELAEIALSNYNLKVERLQFIQHGENTTFRAFIRGGHSYLLRLHRQGYHTVQAIEEELSWLEELQKQQIQSVLTQKPHRTFDNQLVIKVCHPKLPIERYCTLLKWIDGSLCGHTPAVKPLESIGRAIAMIQLTGRGRPVQARRFWTIENLIGTKPKLGSLENMPGIAPKTIAELLKIKSMVFTELKAYEKKCSGRRGLIHADAHFGNVIKTKKGIGLIDFDDCGFGFYAYDLAIPMISIEMLCKKNPSKLDFPKSRDQFLKGYSTHQSWNQGDDRILPYFMAARNIAMVGWLNSRSDNPKLKAKLSKFATETLDNLKKSKLF